MSIKWPGPDEADREYVPVLRQDDPRDELRRAWSRFCRDFYGSGGVHFFVGVYIGMVVMALACVLS